MLYPNNSLEVEVIREGVKIHKITISIDLKYGKNDALKTLRINQHST